ncbi:hypothetical protein B5807_11217 [Epicoccum nigrum]|uniref:Uncharacterized protein n=1 Tax=Epicoccum nigrum TaxID=105696 RepID=A0A1Y2LJK7_EPING|nr:hypothetical protein B5807_11217 [Epicoccum nigrum]
MFEVNDMLENFLDILKQSYPVTLVRTPQRLLRQRRYQPHSRCCSERPVPEKVRRARQAQQRGHGDDGTSGCCKDIPCRNQQTGRTAPRPVEAEKPLQAILEELKTFACNQAHRKTEHARV